MHCAERRNAKIYILIFNFLDFIVGMERFELSRLAAYAPEAYVSASSTTSPEIR